MRKAGLILLCLILSVVSFAQNQFVYIRYNPAHGNASAIVNFVDNLVDNTNGQFRVFISNAATPTIVTNDIEWTDVRTKLLSMQIANEYYAEDEANILHRYFVELFGESVDDKLHLRGMADNTWKCTFIISEAMLHSVDFDALAEVISINELEQRMAVDILTYNESRDLTFAEITPNTMFNFTTKR